MRRLSLVRAPDAFDRERVDFLHRLDEMAGNSKEKHSLKWDLHKKDEQLMDLQKALSDAHVFLYEERAQVLKLTAENDRLKSQLATHTQDSKPHAIRIRSHSSLSVSAYCVLQSKRWRIVSASSISSPSPSRSIKK